MRATRAARWKATLPLLWVQDHMGSYFGRWCMKPNSTKYVAGGPVHLYANKFTACEHHSEDRFAGWQRLKVLFRRNFMEERRAKWAFIMYFSFAAFIVPLFWYADTHQGEVVGLAGKKLRKHKSRLTIVFDIDETIVSYGDKAFRLKAGLVPRPYLAELLDYLTEIDAEVILWSAASDRYVRMVLSAIDPQGVRISTYIPRQKLWYTGDHYYEKNLIWLKRDMNDTLMIENRALAIRNCNHNAILVPDFIRAEYMDTGTDYPPNDRAMLTVKEIVRDLHESGVPVPQYLADKKRRHKDIKQIPTHLAMRQMPEELAMGEFYFIGDKFLPGAK